MNRPPEHLRGRFLYIAVYFLSTRLFLWNFAIVIKSIDYERQIYTYAADICRYVLQ